MKFRFRCWTSLLTLLHYLQTGPLISIHIYNASVIKLLVVANWCLPIVSDMSVFETCEQSELFHIS